MLNQEFKLHPSKQYILLICTVFLLSIIIFVSLPFTSFIKSGGVLLLLVYGGYLFWNNGLLRGAHAITSLRFENEGRWQLTVKSNRVEGKLLGDSTATGMVSVLRFRIPGRFMPMSCVVFKDSLPAGRYRQLLVLLKSS